MKVLKILTIIALALFPFGEILRFEVGNNVVVKPLDVVVVLAMVVFLSSRPSWRDLFNRATWGEKIPRLLTVARNDMRVPVATFGVIGLISLLINLTWLEPKEFFVSASYLLRWVAYAAFAGIVWQFDEKFKKKLLVLLFIDGVIILFAGFLQYFFYNSLKNLYHLGWDEHMHRMFSVFFDPNFAGAFFVLFFLFVGGMLSAGSSLKLDPKRFGAIYKIAPASGKYFLSFVLVLTLIAIFLTFSRGALLSLIVGSAVFSILIKRAKLFFALLGVIALFVVVVSPQFYDENMNLFRTASSKARIGNYETALKLMQDKPLLGVGFNAYRYAKEESGIQMGWVKAPSHADAGVDNSFLFVLATTGIIGFIAYCLLFIAILRRAYFVYKKQSNILGVVIISSIVAMSVNAMFINSLFFAPLLLWMWVLIGLMESTKKY